MDKSRHPWNVRDQLTVSNVAVGQILLRHEQVLSKLSAPLNRLIVL